MILLPNLTKREFSEARVVAQGYELQAYADNGRYEVVIVSDYGKLWVRFRSVAGDNYGLELIPNLKRLTGFEVPEEAKRQDGEFREAVLAWEAIIDLYYEEIVAALLASASW